MYPHQGRHRGQCPALTRACSSRLRFLHRDLRKTLKLQRSGFRKGGTFSQDPVDSGTRCTVFSELQRKTGAERRPSVADISAGLAYSVIKNRPVWVIKITSAGDPKERRCTGRNLHNDAVLRSFERISGCNAVRPDIAGIMGAFGAGN